MPDLRQLLSYGRDFAQGASNSAAANVSMPIDMIAGGLGMMGLPIQEPVGGSAWMQRMGLTAQPQSHLAGTLGEHAALLVPMMAVQKARQNALLMQALQAK